MISFGSPAARLRNPARTARPALIIACLADTLSPIVRIDSGVGPMKAKPLRSTRSAKSAFSDRKPYLSIVSGMSVSRHQPEGDRQSRLDRHQAPRRRCSSATPSTRNPRYSAKRESPKRPTQGIVTVRTIGRKADGTVFMSFERTVLVPKRGHAVDDRADHYPPTPRSTARRPPAETSRFHNLWQDVPMKTLAFASRAAVACLAIAAISSVPALPGAGTAWAQAAGMGGSGPVRHRRGARPRQGDRPQDPESHVGRAAGQHLRR